MEAAEQKIEEQNKIRQETIDLWKKLGKIHNDIRFHKAKQEDFDNALEAGIEFADQNGFCGLLAERATLTMKWVKDNAKFRKLAKIVLSKFTDEQISDLGLRAGMRALMLGEIIKKIEKEAKP